MKIFDFGDDEGFRKKDTDKAYLLDFYRDYITYLEGKSKKIILDFNKSIIEQP